MASNYLLLPMLSTIYLRFEQVTWGVHELNPAFLPLLFCICHGVFLLNCLCATNWTYMQAITFGARDHVTFELGLVTQFRNFLFRGRGERILDIKKKTIFKNLGRLRKKMKTWRIWIFTRHFGNISEAKTSTKRFCLPTKRRALRPLTSYSSV